MAHPWDVRSGLGDRPHTHENPAANLLALLLVVLVPTILVAVIAGWRPLDPAQTDALRRWLARAPADAAGAQAAQPGGRALADGWFYPAAQATAGEVRGYAVTDADGVEIWSAYQRLGGPAYLGYPVSQRFSEDGAVLQVFQRGVLRHANPDAGVALVPLLDQLHAAGRDPELSSRWGIPELTLPAPDQPTPEQMSDRLDALAREHPAVAAYASNAPLGLPTSTVEDQGSFSAVRFQRGVLQEWKEDVPWATAGEVTAANVGEMAVTLGMFPAEPLAPVAAPGA
jgi:hypothetical protein